MNRFTRSPAFPYAVAVAVTVGAALVRAALDPLLGYDMIDTTFFVAIVLSGWKGGWGPAALSTLLSLLISLYAFVPPRMTLHIAEGRFLAGLVTDFIASALVVAIIAAMHAARRRAQQQRELLETTLASIGDAVLTTDTAGSVHFLNPVAERLTGWTRAAAEGQPLARVLRILDEQTRAPAEDPVARVLHQRQMVALGNHTVLVARDGSERLVDDSAAPLRDEQGAMSGVVLVFRDISARRLAERERQAAQDNVIAILESIPDAFARVNGRWGVEYVNNQYERRFGRPGASELGKELWECWPELCGTAAEVELRRVMAVREMAEFEHHYAPWQRWFAVKACPVGSGDLAIFCQDITPRKRAEEALRASEQRFRLAAEAVNGIIYDYDVASGHVERSQGLYEVTGYRPEEVPPTAAWWWDQIHPDDRGELQAACLAPGRIASGRGLHVYRVRHKDGHYIYLSDRSQGVCDEQGRLLRQVGCGIDISALKDAENHLKEADRRKDEFLATLAHELRNPLAPIGNAVQFLKAKLAAEPSAGWGLGVIERQMQTMARLLDDLLDVSRISRNKLELRRQTVQLADILRQAVETSQPLIDIGGHELSVTLPPDPVELDADPVRLEQVFANLLTNAAKYTPAGGHIRVTAMREDGRVAVSVRDDGIGIAPEMLPRLFEIFAQAESALERAQGGLGIGLSLVHGLVELHGGSIEAHSDGAGHGSEFVVRLPVRARHAAPARPEAPAEGLVRTPCRILVADDNRDGADSMAMTLEALGHEVSTAYDGEQALALAQQRRPDVILLDIGMPKKNGYDVCRAIRATDWGRRATLVALTGWGQEEDRRRAESAGFDHHLVKPADFAELAELLALAQPAPR